MPVFLPVPMSLTQSNQEWPHEEGALHKKKKKKTEESILRVDSATTLNTKQ